MFPFKSTVIFLSIIITSHIILPSINNNKSVKTIVNKVDWDNEEEKKSFQQLPWSDKEQESLRNEAISKKSSTQSVQAQAILNLQSHINSLGFKLTQLEINAILTKGKMEKFKKINTNFDADNACTIS